MKGCPILKKFKISVLKLPMYQPANGLFDIDKKHFFINSWFLISNIQNGKVSVKEPWLLSGIIQLKKFKAIIIKIRQVWLKLNELKNFLLCEKPTEKK